MQVALLLNEPREGPGLIGEILKQHRVTVRPFHREQSRWPSLEELSALIVMGGPQSANDGTESMQRELSYVREAIGRGIPYLGICLGLQVGVKAMGGLVVKNSVREVAFSDDNGEPYTVKLTAEGLQDSLFQNLESPLPVFHLHGETVVLKPGMVTLGHGKNCEQQIVRTADRAYGIQGHFEVTPALFAVWREEDNWLRACDPLLLQSQADLLLPRINAVGRRIFTNFFKMVGTAKGEMRTAKRPTRNEKRVTKN